MQITVLGATGGIGGAVTDAFLAAGHRVVALARRPDALERRAGLTIIEGDVRDPDALAVALDGSDAVFHGINVPYPDWDPGMVEVTDAVAAAAESRGQLLLFPGNLYGLGPDFDEPLTEDASRQPVSRKGDIRNRLEDRLRLASEGGARVVIVRAGDFFGVSGDSTWMAHLTGKALNGGPISYPTNLDTLHAWTYGPDLARVFVALAERASELGPFEVFHFEGHVVDGHTWVRAVREGLGAPDRRQTFMPWFWMQPLRLFVPMIREIWEMRYLWEQPVRMSGARLQAFLGEVTHTPFGLAIATSLGGTRSPLAAAPSSAIHDPASGGTA